MFKYLILLIAIGLEIGCTKVDSEKISFEKIFFKIKIINEFDVGENKSIVSCTVVPYLDSDLNRETIVALIDGDGLTCNGISMSRIDTIFGFYYYANIPEDTHSSYQINFIKQHRIVASAQAEMLKTFKIFEPKSEFKLTSQEKLIVKVSSEESEILTNEISLRLIDEQHQVTLESKSYGEDSVELERLSDKATFGLPKVTTPMELTIKRESTKSFTESFKGSIELIRALKVNGFYSPNI